MQRNRGKQQSEKDQRPIQEKWRYQGKLNARKGKIKERNSKDLTEAEEIKRWQGYTEELYMKSLNDPDNHDNVVIHLQPDILECEVNWALGSITTNKASGGNEIPAELLQM